MLIDTQGQPVDPFAPLGSCSQCGAAAWATTQAGLLCPSHEAVWIEMLDEQSKQLPFVDEIVERLEDVGFVVKVMYPYVIVTNLKNRQLTSMEVAEALDIEPEFCTRSVSGDIRITCD